MHGNYITASPLFFSGIGSHIAIELSSIQLYRPPTTMQFLTRRDREIKQRELCKKHGISIIS